MPVAVPQTESGQKPRYQDPFQEKIGAQLEKAGKIFEGQGRNILYGIGALAVLGILIWLILLWNNSSSQKAQAALGRAMETQQAQIIESPPAGSTEKTFKTEADRAQAAITEFEKVAAEYGGSVGEKAKYFIAINRLTLDRAAGTAELETLSGSGGEVGSLSKFALAQVLADDGKIDQAAALYAELSASSDPIISKETINWELAQLYEKQGKKAEAVEVLFELVKTASEAKDLDGKSVPLTATAQKAKDKLTQLDPERAKQLPEIKPDLGSLPF